MYRVSHKKVSLVFCGPLPYRQVIVFRAEPPQGMMHSVGGRVSLWLWLAGGLASHYYEVWWKVRDDWGLNYCVFTTHYTVLHKYFRFIPDHVYSMTIVKLLGWVWCCQVRSKIVLNSPTRIPRLLPISAVIGCHSAVKGALSSHSSCYKIFFQIRSLPKNA